MASLSSLVLCGAANRWNNALLVSLVCFLSLSLDYSSCTDFSITWTPEGVSRYSSSSPLQVRLGDTLRFTCPSNGSFAHSTVWIQKREEQYKDCDCLAGDPGSSCDPGLYKNGYCSPPVSAGVLVLNSNDANLGSFLSFNAGQQYYLVSYTSNLTLAGVLSDVSMGGQCLQGLRMSFSIAAVSTDPPTVSTESTTATTQETTNTTGSAPPTDVFSGDSGSGPGSPETTTTTTTEEVLIEILPAQGIQDWHIILISVLIGLIAFIIVVFVAAIVAVSICRRRADKRILNSDLKVPDGGDRTRDTSNSHYPNEVFEDPLG